jgi:lipid-binding SYLF domain-containing protein
VEKAGIFAFELQASLEEYPTVNITETFNITVASSEIICNQLLAASYHIKDTRTIFAMSYSNQTFAA